MVFPLFFFVRDVRSGCIVEDYNEQHLSIALIFHLVPSFSDSIAVSRAFYIRVVNIQLQRMLGTFEKLYFNAF